MQVLELSRAYSRRVKLTFSVVVIFLFIEARVNMALLLQIILAELMRNKKWIFVFKCYNINLVIC